MPADLGARVEQVLAVVQGQQQAPRPQRVGERLEQRAPGLLADPHDRRDARDHQLGLLQVSQFHEPDPVGKLLFGQGQEAQREPGLADAPGPAQGQRARSVQHLAELSELPLPADEAIRFLGQMCLDLVHVSFPLGHQQHPQGKT
jgi:hypothetical protein